MKRSLKVCFSKVHWQVTLSSCLLNRLYFYSLIVLTVAVLLCLYLFVCGVLGLFLLSSICCAFQDWPSEVAFSFFFLSFNFILI